MNASFEVWKNIKNTQENSLIWLANLFCETFIWAANPIYSYVFEITQSFGGKTSLTVNHTVCGQYVSHAGGRWGQCQTEGAQQRSTNGHFSIRKHTQKWSNEQPWEVHHHIQGAHDDCRTGRSDIQFGQQIAKQQTERGFYWASGQLRKPITKTTYILNCMLIVFQKINIPEIDLSKFAFPILWHLSKHNNRSGKMLFSFEIFFRHYAEVSLTK